jgi:hypothetical protein
MRAARFVFPPPAAMVGLICAAVIIPAPAMADRLSADQCATAAEQAQPLRDAGKLRMARDRLLECTRPECPSVVRTDCTKWLADVDAAMPSVVVSAVDSAGADVDDVRVIVDGNPLASRLGGKEIAIDPGTHRFRFEHDGSVPIERQISIREAEQRRIVSISFAPSARGAAASSSTSTTSSLSPPSSERPSGSRRSLVLPIALMGTGAAGLAVASYFWFSGLADRSTMESGCATTHSCSQSAVDSARGKLLAGDLFGAAGIATAAVGFTLLYYPPKKADSPAPAAAALRARPPSSDALIRVRPVAGGGVFDVVATF